MPLMADLFGQSPIRPVQQHMKAAVACAREVLPLFEDMAAGRTDAFASRREAIDDLEHRADDIKNAIRSRLPRRLFMAFERRDMLDILDNQDSIADYAQDVAELVDPRPSRGQLIRPLGGHVLEERKHLLGTRHGGTHVLLERSHR